MIRRRKIFFIVLIVLSALTWSMTAYATTISNFQSAFRMEGADLEFTPNLSGWDGGDEVASPGFFSLDADFIEFGSWGSGGSSTGLGTIIFEVERAAGVVGPGLGSFHAYFDLEVDVADNDFLNEYGEADASGNDADPDAFGIDEPGFRSGDIPWDFQGGFLDNYNAVPGSDPDNVAVALGWENFALADGQSARLTIVVSDSGDVAPGSSFTIRHIDPDSSATITFSGAMEITGGPVAQLVGSPPPLPAVTPEPSTLILLASGILGLASGRMRRLLRS